MTSRPHPPHDGASPDACVPDSDSVVGAASRDVFCEAVSAVWAFRGRTARTRGVAAGRSAQQGTSGAATGGGGRSAPDPYCLAARNLYAPAEGEFDEYGQSLCVS